jgi:predicted nucleic acid-binding protein
MIEPLIDSAVVIDYLRGHAGATAFLNAQRAAGRPVTHVVVVAEVLEGARDATEQSALKTFFAGFDVIPANEADLLLSLDLLAGFRLSHGVGWPDCLIAATAIRSGRPVATTNVKHFTPFPNLQVLRPY